ncbi:GntR family transcriptional regulator [Pandoraea sp. ISTKB]|uniref:GntR family transcriptional regulator n=1 Tax=Pandoraea sp. ISTKB TaxID=1586708 RepID=UPI0008473D80|nr:GntR family transcriptional regulator [Pandoraea sp. ISTKB]ODP32701.1 GntR family transcriptional regulator [Pandoraea sp. ISTKB]
MTDLPETPLTPTQQRVVREIVAITRKDALAVGDRLNESSLATRIGTSRSPVNVALRHLSAIGALSYDANRGFSIARPPSDIDDGLGIQPDDALYLAMARARLANDLPEIVSEAELMRRFDAPRTAVLRVLSTMQQEGWVERSVGHGWQFMPMIDSLSAYEESYVFRSAVEPAALLSPTFVVKSDELLALRKRQQHVAEDGYRTMSPLDLFEANREFHEALADWSNNRFFSQAVRRIHRMRRLIEYRKDRAREPRRQDALEHLAILDAIEAGNLRFAATLMRDHIESGRHIAEQAGPAFAAGERGSAQRPDLN